MTEKQVNIRLSDEQKDRWEEYVDESREYSTLSDLIRTSVEREISDVDTDTGGEIQSEQLDVLDERTNSILSRLNAMESALGDAVETMRTSGVQVDDETTTVWQNIPVGVDSAKTPPQIVESATGIAANERMTRKYEIILDQLAENTGVVERTYHVVENGTEYQDETPHYYKDQ